MLAAMLRFLGNDAWLATNTAVLKGSTIGSGSIAAANATVHGNVPSGVLYSPSGMKENYGTWNREHP